MDKRNDSLVFISKLLETAAKNQGVMTPEDWRAFILGYGMVAIAEELQKINGHLETLASCVGTYEGSKILVQIENVHDFRK